MQPSFLKDIPHKVTINLPCLLKNPEYKGPNGTIASPLELVVGNVPGYVNTAAPKKGKGKGRQIAGSARTDLSKLPEWKGCQHLFK